MKQKLIVVQAVTIPQQMSCHKTMIVLKFAISFCVSTGHAIAPMIDVIRWEEMKLQLSSNAVFCIKTEEKKNRNDDVAAKPAVIVAG